MTTCDAPVTLPIKPCNQRRSRSAKPRIPPGLHSHNAWCCLAVFGGAWGYIICATSAVGFTTFHVAVLPSAVFHFLQISPAFFCPPQSCLSTPPPSLRSPRFQIRSLAPPASAPVLNSHPSSARRPVLIATALPHKILETAARPSLLSWSAESQSSRRRTRASVLAWVFHPRCTFLLRHDSLRTRWIISANAPKNVKTKN